MSRSFSIVKYGEGASERIAEGICAELNSALERAGGERYTPIKREGNECVAEVSVGYEFPGEGGVVNLRYSVGEGIMLALYADVAGGKEFFSKNGRIPSAIKGVLDTSGEKYSETPFRSGWQVSD